MLLCFLEIVEESVSKRRWKGEEGGKEEGGGGDCVWRVTNLLWWPVLGHMKPAQTLQNIKYRHTNLDQEKIIGPAPKNNLK